MDFIITWVDSNDPEWKAELEKHKKDTGDTIEARFRDWRNLRFWFRGVEKFAPWVDKIHFVTYGHRPEWLNVNHPKLHMVRHRDYIPEKYLPTFNSRTIELNFHRIEGLSEEYVNFNDDMFLINHTKREWFFKNGKPCDMANSTAIVGKNRYHFTYLHNITVLNNYFDKSEVIKQHPFNWFNLKYRRNNVHNLALWYIRKAQFTGFVNFHLPQPLRKKTLALLWEKEFDALDEACSYTFRNDATVNVYLQRCWELASNNFYPINLWKLGKKFEFRVEAEPAKATAFIRKQKRPMVCLNDYETLPDHTMIRDKINRAFQEILPEKSRFEV